MKILVISQYFWPEDFRINDICVGLKDMGHEVEILTGLPNYPEGKFYKGYSWFKRGEEKFCGMKVHRIPIVPRGKNNSLMLSLNYISFALNSLFALPKLCRGNYDRIFVFQVSPITTAIPAIILKKIKKVPISIYVQDLWPETLYSIIRINNRMLKRAAEFFCKGIYRAFDQLIIASRGYREKLTRAGIEDSNIYYLPQWAEETKEYTEKFIMDSLEGKFVATFAGNIGKAQSVDTIIAAAQLAQDDENIRWLIIGNGSEYENIRKKVERLNLSGKVLMLGRKPSLEMHKYFSMSDALILTLRNEEILKLTLPAKVQSYMAAGKPILAAISGEGKSVIEESGCGFAAGAEDYNGLYENTLRLYNMNKSERNRLGENGRKYFYANFHREKLLKGLIDILCQN